MKKLALIVTVFVSTIFIGCGSGGDDLTDDNDHNFQSYVTNWEGKTKELRLWSLSKAKFKIDTDCNGNKYVTGIDYSYNKKDGTVYKNYTDNNGSLSYEFGQAVTFSIGALIIGSSYVEKCYLISQYKEKEVSGLCLSENNQTIKNITAFLYSIDDDNDSSNGIQITETMKNNVHEGEFISWDSSTFTTDTNVITLIENITSNSTAGKRNTVFNDINILNAALVKTGFVHFYSVDWHDDDYQGVSENFNEMELTNNHLVLKDGSWGTIFDGYVVDNIYSGNWSMDNGGSGTFKYVTP